MTLSPATAQWLGTPAPAGLPPGFRLPAVERSTPAGLETVVCRDPTVPLVHLQLVARAGSRFDPPGREGTAALTAALLPDSSDRRSGLDVATAAEELGADLLTHAGRDTATVALEPLAADLETGLALLVDLLTAPGPRTEAVAAGRERQLARIRRAGSQPGAVAAAALDARLHRDSPWGRPPLGTAAGLAATGRDTVVDFRRRCYAPHRLALIAVGDLREDRLGDWLATHLPPPSDPPAEEAAPPPTPAPAVGDPATVLVDLPAATQTALRIGHSAVARTHPDFVPLTLVAEILERRLRRTLRDRLGVTYEVGCRFEPADGPGTFSVTTAVDHDSAGRAAAEVRDEIRRLREGAVSAEEVESARSRWSGELLRSFQTLHGAAALLRRLVFVGRPADAHLRWAEELNAIDRRRATDLARRHLHPDDLVVVAVGPLPRLRGTFPEAIEMESRPPKG